MITRAIHRKATSLPRFAGRLGHGPLVCRRGLIAAPKPNSGPLMERRSDRELPDPEKTDFRWSRSLPWFIATMVVASTAIFNYQKFSSPVVNATMYALRASPQAREYLGDDIAFKNRIPWIAGEMNQVKGRINIHFPVKGTRATGVMRFVSRRRSGRGVFETSEWSLETEDGRTLNLLEEADPSWRVQPDVVAVGDEHLQKGGVQTRKSTQMSK